MNEKLYDKVAKLISKELNIEISKVQPKSDFVNDLGCDSLDTVELVMAVENEFGITITDEAAEKTKTVEDLTNLIQERMK